MKPVNLAVKLGILVAIVLLTFGCLFEIVEVAQPVTASVNSEIVSHVTVKLTSSDPDENPHYGIFAVQVPEDWSVTAVTFSGDYGEGAGQYLGPDDFDGELGGAIDMWTVALDAVHTPPTGYKWVVYQTVVPHMTILDETVNDVSVYMKTGAKTGKYELAYFVTNAALDFSTEGWTAMSKGHVTTVE